MDGFSYSILLQRNLIPNLHPNHIPDPTLTLTGITSPKLLTVKTVKQLIYKINNLTVNVIHSIVYDFVYNFMKYLLERLENNIFTFEFDIGQSHRVYRILILTYFGYFGCI